MKKKKHYFKGKRIPVINKTKGIIPKGTSTNQTKGPMQGTTQEENLV